MRVRFTICALMACFCLAATASAQQDSVKADPKHYTVLSENDQVRIVKVHYGPHEKSVMHTHPNLVAVYLTDLKGKFTFPDGKTQELTGKAGDAQYIPAVAHLPENTSDSAFDLILVELKGHPAKAAMKSDMKSDMK